MIVCKEFPDKVFATKELLFAELRANVDRIIALKKADVYKSYEKGSAYSGFLLKSDSTTKSPHMKDGYIYPVINTTKYMDSHKDVHFDGIWSKSAKEQDGKLFYVADHMTNIDNIIAWPEDVKVMVKSVAWSFVGKPYPGTTEALIYEIPKNKIVHDKAREIIRDKRPVQNSVRMMYVKISLGMNSELEDDKSYKAYYDEKIESIANREAVEEHGYFWGIEEAKIVTEGSMVIRGSNDATPLRQKHIEPDNSTQQRAVKDTRFTKGLQNLLTLTKEIK